MSKVFVLINGPPGCGKDTAVQHIAPYLHNRHLKFSAPLKRMAAALLDKPVSWIEANKESKVKHLIPEGRGTLMTVRELLIWLSEDVMKPKFGEDVLGRLLWNEAQDSPSQLFLVSDCGFAPEIRRVIGNAGRGNCMLVRLHRLDHDFTGDSRSYLPDGLCNTVDVWNDHSIHLLAMKVLRHIQRHFTVTLLQEPIWVK